MMGFMLLFLLSVATSLQENCPTADTSLVVHQADQLLALQDSLRQKELYLLEQDEVMSDLQRKLQGVKEDGDHENQEVLVDMNSKVEEQEAKVAELETILERKNKELCNSRGEIQSLQLAAEKQESEFKQLETLSASQIKQLDQVQKSLHLIEDSLLEAQARVDQKEQAILKGSWTVALKKAWRKVVLVAGGYARVYESKVLKHLNVLRVCFETYLHKAQESLKEEVQAAWKLSRDSMDGPVKIFGPYVNQLESFLQPHALKMRQYYNKALRFGIKHHLQLQRRIRKTLQKNRYLVSIATKEVTWLLASALLILPLYGALLLVSSFFGKGKRSRSEKGAASHRRKKVRQPRHIQR